jgi:hypothetical protein
VNVTNDLTNPFLPTVTLPTGETVYAGRDRKSDPFRAMKYGNQKQAEAKLFKIQPTLEATGKKGAVVRQGDRFLVLVYEAKEEDFYEDVAAISETGWLMGPAPDQRSDNLLAQMGNTPNTGDLSRFKFWDEKLELPKFVSWDLGCEIENAAPERPTTYDYPRLEGTPFDSGLSGDWRERDQEVIEDVHRQTASKVFNVPESEVIYGNRFAIDVDATEAEMLDRDKALKLMQVHGRHARGSYYEARTKPQGPGKIFATVNGPRINPRNRHNQGNVTEHVIISNPPARLSANERTSRLDDNRRREILKYKLTGGV